MEGWIKMSLYKFTHIPLLKNDAQLKQKSDKKPKKKKNHPNLFLKKSFKKIISTYKKKPQSTMPRK